MAISGSGGSKWLDLSGYWLDLGGIHPGWSVGAIWTHRNCPGGLQGGQKWPKNAIKRAFMAISGTGGSKWLDLSGSWLDLGGIHPGWSVGAIWTHRNCPRGPPRGSERAQKCHKMRIYGHKWHFWPQNHRFRPKIIIFGQNWLQLPQMG